MHSMPHDMMIQREAGGVGAWVRSIGYTNSLLQILTEPLQKLNPQYTLDSFVLIWKMNQ